MKKLFVYALLLSGVLAHANDIVLPFSAGGSTSTVMQTLVPDMETAGMPVQVKFVGNCQTARAQLGARPAVYVWSNDLDCAIPGRANNQNFVALLHWMPLYLCGRKSTLSEYSTDTPRLAVNVGEFYTKLGRAIGQKINPNTRVINYANTGATRTALKTNEVDLSLSTNGLSMAAEGLVTCYAATTSTAVPGMVTVQSMIGNVTGSVFSFTSWMATDGIQPDTVIRYRDTVQKIMQGTAYQDMTTKKLRRELPDATVEQQIQRVNQNLIN